MKPPASDRWLSRVLVGGLVAFVVVAAGSIGIAVRVAQGRATVEHNVHALIRLQKAIEVPDQAPAALTPLTADPAPAVAAAAAKALAAPVPAQQLGGVIGALRAENARESARLGRWIDGLTAIVGLLIAFGLIILWLLHRLRESTRAIARLAEQRLALAEAEHARQLATVRALAATTAHEVNNPLTAMALNLDLMRAEELSAPLRAAVEANADGVGRIAKIVAELRGLAAPMPTADAELGTVIDTTFRLLEHRIAPRAEIVRDLAERGRVKGEYVALGQVVTNLLLNAAEAFGDRPRAENQIVLATRSIDADWVELSVTDNGPGFDPGAFAKLATPFFTTKPNGNGLGLFACRRIVERFEGQLELQRPGRGARVAVRLRRLQRSTA